MQNSDIGRIYFDLYKSGGYMGLLVLPTEVLHIEYKKAVLIGITIHSVYQDSYPLSENEVRLNPK